MRRILVFDRITPEGYFTGADDNYQDLVVMDGELDRDMMAGANEVSYLFGRKTYELMAAYWPNVTDQSGMPPAILKMARSLNESEKIVFSRTVTEPTWKNTRVIADVDVHEIQAMKQGAGNDMLIIGSGSIVSQLTAAGLIDEYMLVISPLLLGKGKPLFAGLDSKQPLELKEAKAYTSGNVLLRYARRD